MEIRRGESVHARKGAGDLLKPGSEILRGQVHLTGERSHQQGGNATGLPARVSGDEVRSREIGLGEYREGSRFMLHQVGFIDRAIPHL